MLTIAKARTLTQLKLIQRRRLFRYGSESLIMSISEAANNIELLRIEVQCLSLEVICTDDFLCHNKNAIRIASLCEAANCALEISLLSIRSADALVAARASRTDKKVSFALVKIA